MAAHHRALGDWLALGPIAAFWSKTTVANQA